ncbi:GntR family transcriptional regulator [Paenilisteria rocourtiae]|uniref:GntR family transcriptional regulator n=1 Tax=Listeria rocourtiae TaxID=647910 RepID=A0A4R6ZTE4_9LIST|nr:GntR family transcriptional regulator [Listeria rocourtiae]EUJ48095.1 transcriptional regulator [Listeria rocourtiae FSL F6-920]MBC1603204.1 GntR family transcriptional regulator [Listeria rocourtiae]TDR55514.1 GntR family transcriptional regulator [Listeria rocourtiae]
MNKLGNETLESKAHRMIKEKIQCGEYQAGQRLIEAEVSRELELSRTPVRKAFAILTVDGYLEFEDYKGVIVKNCAITKERYIEMLDIMELFLIATIDKIEAKSLPFSNRRISDKAAEFFHLEEATERQCMDYQLWFLNEFLSYAKNEYYLQVVNKLYDDLLEFAEPDVFQSAIKLFDKTLDNYVGCGRYIEEHDYAAARATVKQIINERILFIFR